MESFTAAMIAAWRSRRRAGNLWIVATPIARSTTSGRGRADLASVEIISPRTPGDSARCGHAGVAAGRRLYSFHDHNERARLPWVLWQLEQGQSVARLATPARRRSRTRLRARPGGAGVLDQDLAAVPRAERLHRRAGGRGQPPLPAVLAGSAAAARRPAPPDRRARRLDRHGGGPAVAHGWPRSWATSPPGSERSGRRRCLPSSASCMSGAEAAPSPSSPPARSASPARRVRGRDRPSTGAPARRRKQPR